MKYFKYEVSGWLNTQVVKAQSLDRAIELIPNSDYESSWGWKQISREEYTQIIQSW